VLHRSAPKKNKRILNPVPKNKKYFCQAHSVNQLRNFHNDFYESRNQSLVCLMMLLLYMNLMAENFLAVGDSGRDVSSSIQNRLFFLCDT
jgi:hypothetical protein